MMKAHTWKQFSFWRPRGSHSITNEQQKHILFLWDLNVNELRNLTSKKESP